MHKGKKYVDSAKTIDRTKQYDPAEALSTVVSTAKAKFDETIELHVKLGCRRRQRWCRGPDGAHPEGELL